MQADCVVLELEDGVALTSKETARANTVSWLNENEARSSQCREIGVRVNDLHSGLIDDDLHAIATAEHQPKVRLDGSLVLGYLSMCAPETSMQICYMQAFMVPKLESASDIGYLQGAFTRHYGKESLASMIKQQVGRRTVTPATVITDTTCRLDRER